MRYRYNNTPGIRDSFYRIKYGIDCDIFEQLLTLQNNVCKICKQKEIHKHQSGTLRRLSVDHCHLTGKVRGLLCHRCNTLLGIVKDDASILLAAGEYLNGN